MRLTLFAALSGAIASVSAASSAIPKRPDVVPFPHNAGRAMPPSPPRDERICRVKPSCTSGRDDAPKILAAFEKCNDGGTVVLDKDYLIASKLNLTFLKHVDVVITGYVAFNDDIYSWHEDSFKFPFQNMSSWWIWGGEDVNIYGDLENTNSTLDGRGQKYWDEALSGRNPNLRRPMLWAFDGMHGATMSNLRMRNSPMWFNIIANSSDIVVSNMDLWARSTSQYVTANSDGWDTYRSEYVVIQNSSVDAKDDCVSFKPNSTNLVIQNMNCTGSHGMSVGSLGQYKGVVDIVENLYIYNTTMRDASDGARIKVWPGIETDFQSNLNGGGGLGRVNNVTWDIFHQQNIERAITITQCYGQSNQTLCEEFPANLTITNIMMKNFYGETAAKLDPRAGGLVCSANDRCGNIRAENIQITVPSKGKPQYECWNVDRSLLDFECVDPGKIRDITNG